MLNGTRNRSSPLNLTLFVPSTGKIRHVIWLWTAAQKKIQSMVFYWLSRFVCWYWNVDWIRAFKITFYSYYLLQFSLLCQCLTLWSVFVFYCYFFAAFALPRKLSPNVCLRDLFWTAPVKGFSSWTCCFDCFRLHSVCIERQNLFARGRLLFHTTKKTVFERCF